MYWRALARCSVCVCVCVSILVYNVSTSFCLSLRPPVRQSVCRCGEYVCALVRCRRSAISHTNKTRVSSTHSLTRCRCLCLCLVTLPCCRALCSLTILTRLLSERSLPVVVVACLLSTSYSIVIACVCVVVILKIVFICCAAMLLLLPLLMAAQLSAKVHTYIHTVSLSACVCVCVCLMRTLAFAVVFLRWGRCGSLGAFRDRDSVDRGHTKTYRIFSLKCH